MTIVVKACKHCHLPLPDHGGHHWRCCIKRVRGFLQAVLCTPACKHRPTNRGDISNWTENQLENNINFKSYIFEGMWALMVASYFCNFFDVIMEWRDGDCHCIIEMTPLPKNCLPKEVLRPTCVYLWCGILPHDIWRGTSLVEESQMKYCSLSFWWQPTL